MKLYNLVQGAVLFMLLFCSFIYPQDSLKVLPRLSDRSIDKNYLEGVKSDNMGLRVSSAYYLGERQSTEAVIPLMKILHNDKAPEARIVAALSLFKIGDSRGIYAIGEAMKMDNNKDVRNMCKVFYQMYLANKEEKK